MLILSTNPSGNTVFCDDIREEVTGKKSLMGVYNGAMILGGAAPAIIQQLCILTTIRLDHEMLPKKFTVKIIFEDEDFVEQIISSMDTELPAPELPEGSDMIFAAKDGAAFAQMTNEAFIGGLVLSKNGRIKVRLYIDDDVFALGSLRVIFLPQEAVIEPEPVHSNRTCR
jgi:hypothetical protein